MAKSPYGILGAIIGKVGTVIGYILNGQPIVRSRGKITKAPTELQLYHRRKLPAVDAFLNPLKEFIKVGMGVCTVGTTWNYHNAAVSYNHKNAVIEDGDQFLIDYAKAVITLGKMEVLTDVQVEMTPKGARFSWDQWFKGQGTKDSDQVMLLAYFPSFGKADFETAGAKRSSGGEQLSFAPMRYGSPFHAYISFISQDRKNISNNQYLGEFMWEYKK